ncbi:MAG: sulfate adenylyltransferase subunit 1 [Mycobacteriales bacterium]
MSAVLRVATAGSVDDGKSTLIGRLLHDTRTVLADQLDAVADASRRRGLGEADLALLVDGLKAEREQGITIDVAYRYFATARRAFILADTPGHEQYTRNMVTGASTADVAVVLVDARAGLLTQSRRHAAIAGLLGVPHVVLAVNKMDLVGYDEGVFDELVREFSMLAERVGLRSVTAIPLSALHGDNVAAPSDRLDWYAGPTLLDHLETWEPAEPPAIGLRFPVQYVLRPNPDYRGYSGRVAAGRVSVGDRVVALPSGRPTSVAGIDTADGPLRTAVAGQSVTLLLADQLDIARGDLIATEPPPAARALTGTVCWLHETPGRPGDRLLLRHGTRQTRAILSTLDGTLDLVSLDYRPADQLSLNDLGRVGIRLAEPLHADPYATSRHTGAFLLTHPTSGAILGAGMVEDTS